MGCAPNTPCTPQQVDLAFRESEPFIEREVADRSYRMKRYLVDYAPVKVFPDGIGFTMTKVRFWGDIGPQFDGYEGFRLEERSRPSAQGLAPAHDACGYVWDEVGHGFEELHWRMMERDIRTIPICVKDIRTFWEFQQYQNLIFQNLTEITMNIREQLNRNALLGFSVKHVITSKGLETNSANPYELPNITGVTLGKLNFRILKRLYNAFVREAGMFALDTVDGRPVFGLMSSDDVWDDLFYEEPEVRQDIRWALAGKSDSLISKYAFMDSARGLFVHIPDNSAARYKVDALGNLIRVFPYERNVSIQSGTRPAPNPDYDNAPFEFVQILTRDVFALRSRKAISTVGGETDFEAETGLFDWKWHNPPRWCDPNRRVGYYYANGNIGVEPGDFTDMPGILVQRRPIALDPAFWPAATCPEEPVDCENQLATQGCPCAQIVGCCEDFTDPNSLQLRFSTALVGVAPFAVKIRLNTGAIVSATVTTLSADGKSAVVDFGEPVVCDANLFVEIACVDSDLCSTDVVTDLCEDDGLTRVLTTELPLKDIDQSDGLPVDLCALTSDGSYVTVHLANGDADAGKLQYTVTIDAVLPEGACIEKLSIPTDVDADCPACPPDEVTCADGLPD